MKLSVTIITLNEEKDLPRCLESVKNLADEIIVVDSGSTDKTVNIANKFGAKVYFRKFDNYASQKNYAATKTTGDWILSIDADEEISSELETEIESRINKQKTVTYGTKEADIVAYSIPRKNIIFGKFIKHTRWQPELDRHVWLWKRGSGVWRGDVHEEFVVKGKIGKLTNHKIHYQYNSVSEFLDMINRYSDIQSFQMNKQGIKFSFYQLFTQTLYNFFVRYFYRLGFLDGFYGFILSFLMSFYHFVLWVKLWHIQKN